MIKKKNGDRTHGRVFLKFQPAVIEFRWLVDETHIHGYHTESESSTRGRNINNDMFLIFGIITKSPRKYPKIQASGARRKYITKTHNTG